MYIVHDMCAVFFMYFMIDYGFVTINSNIDFRYRNCFLDDYNGNFTI